MVDKPICIAAFGARGTGKTAWLKQQVQAARPPRLGVFDIKHDRMLSDVGTPYTDIGAFIKSMKAAKFQSRYMVNSRLDIHEQFKFFCLACWEAGCMVMWVPELPEVTTASKAPAEWRRCVNVGRDYADERTGQHKWLSILADGQRPAECDKSFVSNAEIVHCGRLRHKSDAQYMADMLGTDYKELMTLPNLHWIERRDDVIEAQRGILTFKNKYFSIPPAAKPAPLRKRP